MEIFPFFQYRGCSAECDDKQIWRLHIFVCHVEALLSFRMMGALNSKTISESQLYTLRLTTSEPSVTDRLIAIHSGFLDSGRPTYHYTLRPTNLSTNQVSLTDLSLYTPDYWPLYIVSPTDLSLCTPTD